MEFSLIHSDIALVSVIKLTSRFKWMSATAAFQLETDRKKSVSIVERRDSCGVDSDTDRSVWVTVLRWWQASSHRRHSGHVDDRMVLRLLALGLCVKKVSVLITLITDNNKNRDDLSQSTIIMELIEFFYFNHLWKYV